jgi:hypothetical protein
MGPGAPEGVGATWSFQAACVVSRKGDLPSLLEAVSRPPALPAAS